MKKVKTIIIDKKDHKRKDLYRFNIEFDDGGSVGSCFCYKSLHDAIESMCLQLEMDK